MATHHPAGLSSRKLDNAVIRGSIVERENLQPPRKDFLRARTVGIGVPLVPKHLPPERLKPRMSENVSIDRCQGFQKDAEELEMSQRNMQFIESLSTEELSAALSEVHHQFSPASIAYLKGLSGQKLQLDVTSDSKCCTDNVFKDATSAGINCSWTSDKAVPSSSVDRDTTDCKFHSGDEMSKGYTERKPSIESTNFAEGVDRIPEKDVVTLNASFASTETAFLEQLGHASTSVDSLAWIREPTREQNLRTKSSRQDLQMSRLQEQYMFQDRYELSGMKVLTSGNMRDNIIVSFSKLSYFDGISSGVIDGISRDLNHLLFEKDFALNAEALDATELHNHEIDQEKPGYTLNEICELLRSELPTQRKLARQMLIGILNRREQVTSVEPYCMFLGSKDMPALSSDNQSVASFTLFRNIYNVVKLHLVADDSWYRAKRADFDNFDTNIRRFLTQALIYTVCLDLPSSLPMLIMSGLDDRHAQIESLKVAKAYLYSTSENCVERIISFGMLGFYGHPLLLSPHNRRETVTYDEHIVDSLNNFDKLNDNVSEDEGEINTASKESIVMKCRHARADAFVSCYDAITVLKGYVGNALDYFDVVSKSDESILISGTIAVEIMLQLLKLSSKKTASEQIFIFLLKPMWHSCCVVLSYDAVMDSERRKIKEMFSVSLWELVVEIIRKDRLQTAWFWTNGFYEIILPPLCRQKNFDQKEPLSSYEKLLLRTKFSVAVQALRGSLFYGYGLNVIADMVLAVQISSDLKWGHSNSMHINHCNRENMVDRLHYLWLFEETAVLCSRFLQLYHKFVPGQSHALPSFNVIELINTSRIVVDCAIFVFDRYIGRFGLVHDLETAAAFNMASTVLGLHPSNRMARVATVRGIGLCNTFDLFIGQEPRDEFTQSSEFTKAINCVNCFRSKCMSFAPHMPIAPSNSVDVDFDVWISLELRTAQARFIAAVSSWQSSSTIFTSAPVEMVRILSQCASFEITHSLQQSEAVVMTKGLVAVQNDRLLSMRLLSILVIIESLQGIEEDVLAINQAVIKIIPRIGKLFAYSLCELINFVCVSICDDPIDFTEAILQLIAGTDSDVEVEVKQGMIVTTDQSGSLEGAEALIRTCYEFLLCEIEDSKISSVSLWVTTSFRTLIKGIPISSHWPFLLLSKLPSDSLLPWLKSLFKLESEMTRNNSLFQLVDTAVGAKMLLLMHFASVSLPNKAFYASEKDNFEAEMSSVFMSLLELYSKRIVCLQSFSDNCLATVKKLMRAPHRKQNTSGQLDASMASFSETIVDAALSQATDYNIHSSCLVILLTPSLPWQLREKIWQQLGSLGLLHLAESSFTVTYLPNLLALHESNFSVLQSIVYAMTSLRADDDRLWTITAVGIYHLAIAIFERQVDTEHENVLTRSSFNVLELLKKKSSLNWLLTAIIKLQRYIARIEKVLVSKESSYDEKVVELGSILAFAFYSDHDMDLHVNKLLDTTFVVTQSTTRLSLRAFFSYV